MYHIPRALKIPWFERHLHSTPPDSTGTNLNIVPPASDAAVPIHIPAEVWLHIAEFIPDDTLRDMLGVNKLFFNLALDARYKVVSLKSIRLSTMKRLSRLRDPFVARRVKRLHLRLNHPVSRQESPITSRRWQLQRFQPVRHLSHSSDPILESWPLAALCAPTSFEGFVKGLSVIMPGLVSVEEFSIDSWNWPPDLDLAPFFSAAWAGFGETVRKVSLGGNLKGFKELVTTRPCFNSVQELYLEFTNDFDPASNAVDDEAILSNYVAPFINSVGVRIQSLRIWSWASADLSTFFQHLGPFPALHTFGIRAAFNRSFRDDPSGLTHLIRSTAPTLRELELRLNPSGVLFSETTTHDLLLCEWLSQTITSDDAIAADLQTLQVYPTSAAGGCDVLVDCIKRSADTLKHLLVRDRYLHYEEVERLTQAFSSHAELIYLRLNVWRLTPDLIDLLARNFGGLEKLTLNIADVVIEHDFEEQMQARCYDAWKLYDIDIWQSGSELDRTTMNLITKRIPSVQSFWGTGHK